MMAVISLVAALVANNVTPIGVLALAYWHFSLRKNTTQLTFPGAVILSGVLVTIAALAFATHNVPGFHNAKVIDEEALSQGAVPFSMYLNFDKVGAAFILALCGGFFLPSATSPYQPSRLPQTLKTILLMWGGCILVLLPVGLATGYIAFDPKIMPYLGIWAANNLLFVAFSEEILFRGMIQGSLSKAFEQLEWLPFTAILVSAALFGLSHIYSDWTYVALAAIAGIFYGLAYSKSGWLVSSIMVHFLLNLTHALFFTYPALHS
ncbi:CPBP family intramembrane metalloprotease [Falsochrobactrum sp. TDYN1]|uniref:CPBP family intramembrane metalloprotease n=1 Tax=Falsochrobactrum tianjinense TaxID=2706015 RepID=A0A949UV98_9HYPH|nr:CPBP family intramembrane glutamic endopeptidase [Falsochrobactrum sp. TDYN1]MBV2144642.1 CPBP family intramembrane metalloprotease [Falsochrobactrum sp. TDYN1]